MTVSFRLPKLAIFWYFWWIFGRSKCKRRSLRSQCWMRLFLWFSNIVRLPSFLYEKYALSSRLPTLWLRYKNLLEYYIVVKVVSFLCLLISYLGLHYPREAKSTRFCLDTFWRTRATYRESPSKQLSQFSFLIVDNREFLALDLSYPFNSFTRPIFRSLYKTITNCTPCDNDMR